MARGLCLMNYGRTSSPTKGEYGILLVSPAGCKLAHTMFSTVGDQVSSCSRRAGTPSLRYWQSGRSRLYSCWRDCVGTPVFSCAFTGAQFHYYTLRGPLYAGPSMTRTVRVGDNTSPHLLPRHASECPGNRVGRCCSPPVPPVQRASCMNQNELPGLGTPATTPLYATRI